MASLNNKHSNSSGDHKPVKMQNGFSHVHKKKKSQPGDRPQRLPVHRHKQSFLQIINENNALVVCGETGSGKTTQIPQWCVEYCRNSNKKPDAKPLCVACTQPRRIAAMSIAARVAGEMHVELGQEVGYSVRFESCTSPNTTLKYLTDGMLLREAMLDNQLSTYGVILIDEAHERTLQTEILFGIIKRALLHRNSNDSTLPKLKVIIMSATIESNIFKNFLKAPTLNIEGRQYPVQDMFTETTQSDLLTSTLTVVFQIHRSTTDGDVLVFCSGQDEIQSLIALCKKILRQAPANLQNLTPLALYAALPANQQLKVFDRNLTNDKTSNHRDEDDDDDGAESGSKSSRRVIFATNVAETSVTIPNIKYVIDTGKVKCRSYCPKTGLDILKVTTISKAQAKQRSGRAGRIAAGTCYRLYTQEEHQSMRDHLLPEIKRCNLDGVLLQMISIGVKNLGRFEFLERPEDTRIIAALANLLSLKAIKPIASASTIQVKSSMSNGTSNNASKSSNGSTSPNKHADKSNCNNIIVSLSNDYELTSLGKKICALPLSPQMSRIIIAANELGCLDEALTIVSLLYIENVFHIPANKQIEAQAMLEKFHSNEGDAIMLLKVSKAFKRALALNRTGVKMWCLEHFINIKNLKMSRMIRRQLSDMCKDMGMASSSCGQDTSIVRRALAHGLFSNVATMWNGKYRNKSNNEVHIHPSSCLFKSRPDNIMYVEILETNKCYMRNCTLVDMSWIRELSSMA